MTTTEQEQPKRKKVQPKVLRKEIKRLRASRDNQKDKNRERAKVVKELKDSLRGAKDSRDHWKDEVKELKLELMRLTKELVKQTLIQEKHKNETDMLRAKVKKKTSNWA